MDAHPLAQLARRTMRNKTRILEGALTGHFDDHRGFLGQMILVRIEGLSAQITQLKNRGIGMSYFFHR